MSTVLVCPSAEAASLADERRPSHVLGFASPDDAGAGPAAGALRRGDRRMLLLAFHDIDRPRPGLLAPGPADIAALLAFGASWDATRPLLVHCRMGISRSTAAALILVCARDPGRPEVEVAESLRAAAPCATPNRLMVALADDLLGRAGRLVAAADGIGRGADYRPQSPFALPGRPGVAPGPNACADPPGMLGSGPLSVPRPAG